MKRKVNDYILDFLAAQNVKDVFVLTGGAIAFIIDAFHGREDIRYVCVQHEQAGAMMADGYSRTGPGYGVAMATSGPGATNLITGICCAWFDSIPTIYITGQVNTYEQKGKNKVRQVGFQETEIADMVRPVTKYSKLITSADDIRYELEKATYMAKSGRPGPVLLDIPMDFQRALIDPKKLKGFNPPKEKEYTDTGKKLEEKVKKIVALLKEAKRPVLLAGGGIKLSHAQKEMLELIKITKFPVAASWSGYDVVPRDNKSFIGGIGVYGERAANFTVQNIDVLLTIGSRLDTRQTGGRPETFARESKLIMVDIDQGELDKRRGLTPHIPVNCDAKEFLQALISELKKTELPSTKEWLTRCQEWAKKYPVVLPEHFNETKGINSYAFIKTLSDATPENMVMFADTGAHLTWMMQAFEIKKGQQLFSAFGNSPMGYAFPAALAASIARNNEEIVCIYGDGSMQINIQELQTMFYHKLPVKLFILNNQGYGIIKQFQELYLESHNEATGKGYSNPDFVKVSEAYGIKAIRIENMKELKKKVKQAMDFKGPIVIDVQINPEQKIMPKLEFGRPIEDISPPLPREEFYENMIVKPLDVPSDKDIAKSTEIN
ncbi:biosynthetic-type acetolactate synthase large subunit [soil metagenome]